MKSNNSNFCVRVVYTYTYVIERYDCISIVTVAVFSKYLLVSDWMLRISDLILVKLFI